VKILEIDSERRRLSLSAKRVEDQILPVARAGEPDAEPVAEGEDSGVVAGTAQVTLEPGDEQVGAAANVAPQAAQDGDPAEAPQDSGADSATDAPEATEAPAASEATDAASEPEAANGAQAADAGTVEAAPAEGETTDGSPSAEADGSPSEAPASEESQQPAEPAQD
jgi:small subunit ribosomal protein S1